VDKRKIAAELVGLARRLTGAVHPIQSRTTRMSGGKCITVMKMPWFITEDSLDAVRRDMAKAEKELKDAARALGSFLPAASQSAPDKWAGGISDVEPGYAYVFEAQNGNRYIAMNVTFKVAGVADSAALTKQINLVMGWKESR